MKEETVTPRGLVRRLLDGAKISNAEAARRIGRTYTVINSYTTKGHMPTVSMLVKIAAACGYEVHLIGHGEDITVEAPIDQED